MTGIDELEQRLRRLEDLEAVRGTWLEYCNRLDTHDLEGVGELFTEDGGVEMDGLGRALDGSYEGRDAIVSFYTDTETPRSAEAARRAMTGHLSTNMQVDLDGDEATTLAYFFEIVDDDLVLIGTYQHRMRRDPDRWRIAFLRISIRYRARLEASHVGGQPLTDIVARPV